MAIGELIQTLREERNWSRDDLVKKSGVCRRTIQNIENDETNLTVRTIKKLAAAFNVAPEIIFRALI